MIHHYFKIAYKTLNKNRYYTFLNVFGLVCGTLSALIIANYVGGSLQFDSFHQNKDRIFAVNQEEFVSGNPQKESSSCYWGIGELVKQYPEVINVTRFGYHVESLVKANDETRNDLSYRENRILATDSNFLKIFTFPLVYGNPNTALSEDNSIVLTRAFSRKYFGNTNPIGKALTIRVPWGKETIYKVTGVLDDLPSKSRFNFNFLITQSPLTVEEYWAYPSYSTYALLDEHAEVSELTKKLTRVLDEKPELMSANKKLVVSLESLAKVRLSNTEYLLALVGIFILLISWVNYLNQIIAQSYSRNKQVGIQRILGASSKNLKIQFAVESALICFTSLFLTIVIYLSIEQSLQSFTQGHLLPLTPALTLVNIIFLTIFIVGIILAATLPMVIFSLQNSGATLRNVHWDKVGGIGLRKALVAIQFTLSSIMLIGLFVITNQLDFLKNEDKGINMKNVLIVKAPIVRDTTWGVKRKALELFKEKCAGLPFVLETTSSTTITSEEYRNETFIGLQEKNDKVLVHQNGIDEYFFDLYDVKFIAGHNFIPDAGFKNRNSIILNESAAQNLGIRDFNNMINAKIVDHESKEVYNLIGIVKDYHKTSLKYKIQPMAFKYNIFRGHISLKVNNSELNANTLDQQINSIQQIWEQVYRDAAFNYFFLDRQFEAQDIEDRNFGMLFKFFTALSIVISCLGLFSLSLFISIKRQKEIGVRKVFGASIGEILILFYKSYLGPLLISILIGAPFAYFLMNEWLRNYAYRAEIGWRTMLMALLILILIFFFTVSYHVIKSSIANPVKILKTE